MKIALLLLLTVVLTLGLTPAFAGSASDRTLNPEWHKCAKSTGDYGLANIIFLVILLPFTMYVLLVKSISIQFKISKLKKKNI